MKKILINDTPWQTRIAVTRDNTLQNIYFWSHTSTNLERSFFKATIIKVLPGIQTAFVDIGQERAGFLHISEIDRELALKKMGITIEPEESFDNESGDSLDNEDLLPEKIVAQDRSLSRYQIDIGKIFNEGDTVLVQVSKEPMGQKGAKLSTCFTIPGRFLVLMPNIPRIGISKKIEKKEERQRLRALIKSNLPAGMGAIIRTTSDEQGDSEILQDLEYLVNTWNTIEKRYKEAEPKQKVYEDIDLSLQTVRDHLDSDVEEVLCDTSETQNKLYKFVKNIAPEQSLKIKLYSQQQALFDFYSIEQQIQQALHKKVFLKSGGSIIIESTEAMTVVDVNTGRYTGKSDLEETILKTNLEAAEEIARQLRLRNIGGLIVIDFIDMTPAAHKQKLYRTFEKILKERDKFQSVVLKVSEFGLVQMTRKRSGKTLIQELTQNCLMCHGAGFIKSVETEAYEILRKLQSDLENKKCHGKVTVKIHKAIFDYISTMEYNTVLYLEKRYRCTITLSSQEELTAWSSYATQSHS